MNYAIIVCHRLRNETDKLPTSGRFKCAKVYILHYQCHLGHFQDRSINMYVHATIYPLIGLDKVAGTRTIEVLSEQGQEHENKTLRL
jgi:hypothetical protein